MDVIGRQYATDDLDTVLRTDLTTDLADPQLDVASQYLVPVLGRPHQMIAVIKNAMLPCGILHDRILQKMNLTPRRFIFWRTRS